MATRAESLIRQFCVARRNEIEADTKVRRAKIPAHINVKDLPKAVRWKITRLRQLHQQVAALQESLAKQYGFTLYELQHVHSRLTNPAADGLHDANNKRRADRLAMLDKVQQTAYIAVMGRTPAEARIIIEELQKALRKI